MVMFVIAELCNTFFFRILAQYDQIGTNHENNWFDDYGDFWTALCLLQVGYFVMMVLKYFLVNLVILNSNEKIHEEMIHSVVRSHSYFFDMTPSGRLTNKFSNDLGILDNILSFTFIDAIEGPIISIILIINVFQINVYFIPLGIVNILFIVVLFLICKKAIVNTFQLDLRLKSPLFNMVREMSTGLIQIKFFNKRFYLLSKFANRINSCFRANLTSRILSRAFGTAVNYSTITLMTVGWIIGIVIITPETAGLYGISVVFLIQICDHLQWSLRQLINLESLMLSVERAFLIL